MQYVQHLLQTMESLPVELQQEVVDFADFLAQRRKATTQQTPSAEEIAARRRQGLGELKGRIWMAEDFDAPLADFADY